MIRSITRPKPEEEIDRLLEGLGRVFIIGCGTCTTLTRTGGEPEVKAMRSALAGKGKMVTGDVVLPVACDNLTSEALKEYGDQIRLADVLLIMSCAFGAQTIAQTGEKDGRSRRGHPVRRERDGRRSLRRDLHPVRHVHHWRDGRDLPVTSCHKGMVNGPCGGTNNGKCEIDTRKDCVWTLIYNRLKDLGRLDAMRKYQKPRNHRAEPMPGKWTLAGR